MALKRGRITFKVKSNYGRQGKKIAKGAEELKKNLPLAVRTSLSFIRGEAVTLAPKDKGGRVPKSLKLAWRDLEGDVTTTYPPAFFTEEGTGVKGKWATQPYFIPRSSVQYPLSRAHYNPAPQDSFRPGGSAAVFNRPGGEMIGFMHPGITPQKWFERAVMRSDQKVLATFDKAMKRALSGGGGGGRRGGA